MEALKELEAACTDDSDGCRAKGKSSPHMDALEQAVKGHRLFWGDDERAYIEIITDETGKRVHDINSSGFADWLNHRAYEILGKPVNEKAHGDFLKLLAAKARYGSDGVSEAVYVRVGQANGAYYHDLADTKNRAVEIDAQGWRVVDLPPVAFRLSRGAQSIPLPIKGGGIELLRQFVNVGSERDFTLVVAWLLAALRPAGPYSVLVLQGEQGSSKSTLSRLLKLLIDPSMALLRSPPRKEDDLFIAAQNSHVLVFDNLSRLTDPQADNLCRLATGGGITKRRLYSDGEEFVLEAKRPVILNGIDYIAERPDLVSRSIIVTLRTIDDCDRKTEEVLMSEFEEARPAIMGSLYDAVSHALASEIDPTAVGLTRMADQAAFLAKAQDALELDFTAALRQNEADAMIAALDSEPLARVLRLLLQSAQDHQLELTPVVFHELIRDNWPGERGSQLPANAQGLSSRLDRIAPALRQTGIEVERYRLNDRNRTRVIRAKLTGDIESTPPERPPSATRVFEDISRVVSLDRIHGGQERTTDDADA